VSQPTFPIDRDDIEVDQLMFGLISDLDVLFRKCRERPDLMVTRISELNRRKNELDEILVMLSVVAAEAVE